jgi:two-component sensor histidine kinase
MMRDSEVEPCCRVGAELHALRPGVLAGEAPMSAREPIDSVVETSPQGDSPTETGYRALQLRIRQQEILAELGVRALRNTPFQELLNDAVRLSVEGLEAEFSKVLEYMPSENRFIMRAGVGWDQGLVGTASVGADMASPAGFALHTGKPVISNHLHSEERFRTPELLALHGVRRAMNVILQGDGAPYGVLEVDSRSEGEFSEHDIAFLQGAANILGMALERQRHEQALRAAVERQELLVKEINHRVKNSLQLVAGMLTLQAGDDPELARRLKEASSRIMAIGRAHDRLYRSPQIDKIELAKYLSDICGDLQEVTPNCELVFDGPEPVVLDTDRAINVAVVVNELVANAARHAYPNGTRCRIWVRLDRKGENLARVSVRDEGLGLPPDFGASKPTGLGMRLARALASQTEARLLIERHAPGTEFILEISIARGSDVRALR